MNISTGNLLNKLIWAVIAVLLVVFCFGVTPKYSNLTNGSEFNAEKILERYLQKDKVDINTASLQAFEIDLNNDGISEVLGYVDDEYYCIKGTCSFFVLQKQENSYINIAMMRISAESKIAVKQTKTNGYRDIMLYFPEGKQVVKYKNGWYRYLFVPTDIDRA